MLYDSMNLLQGMVSCSLLYCTLKRIMGAFIKLPRVDGGFFFSGRTCADNYPCTFVLEKEAKRTHPLYISSLPWGNLSVKRCFPGCPVTTYKHYNKSLSYRVHDNLSCTYMISFGLIVCTFFFRVAAIRLLRPGLYYCMLILGNKLLR